MEPSTRPGMDSVILRRRINVTVRGGHLESSVHTVTHLVFTSTSEAIILDLWPGIQFAQFILGLWNTLERKKKTAQTNVISADPWHSQLSSSHWEVSSEKVNQENTLVDTTPQPPPKMPLFFHTLLRSSFFLRE